MKKPGFVSILTVSLSAVNLLSCNRQTSESQNPSTGAESKPGERFEALFRFYGPEKAALDKMWTLPGIEKER